MSKLVVILIVHDPDKVLEEHLLDLIQVSCSWTTCHRRTTARLVEACRLVNLGDETEVRAALYHLLASDQIRPRADPRDPTAPATWHVPVCTRGAGDPIQTVVRVQLQAACQWGACLASWQVVQQLCETTGWYTPALVIQALDGLRQTGDAVCLPAPGWGSGFRWHVPTCRYAGPPVEDWKRHLLRMPWF